MQLVTLATMARARALTFEEFWLEARRPGERPITWTTPVLLRPPRTVIWPSRNPDLAEALQIIDELKDGWRRAYDRETPTAPERALARLAPLLESGISQLQAVA